MPVEGRQHILQMNAPTGLAGAERVLLTYLEHYDSQLLAVSLVSCVNHKRQENAFTSEVEKIPIPFYRLPLSGRIVHEIRETVRLIKTLGIDLLHTHGYRSDFIGLLAARITGVPIVSTVHGWTGASGRLRFYEWFDRRCLKFFDAIICVNQQQLRRLARAGIDQADLHYLPNAVAVARNQEASDAIRLKCATGFALEDSIVLYAGRLSPEKGISNLISAFDSAFCSDSKIKLMIVGEGPLENDLRMQASRLECRDRIIFAGHRSDIRNFYAFADMCILPSFTEGLPMVMLEAMSFAVPCVCTRVGGIPDVIEDTVNGLLVEPGDRHQLSEAMKKVLLDKAYARELGRRAQQTVLTRFSAGRWAMNIDSIYLSVIGRYKEVRRS